MARLIFRGRGGGEGEKSIKLERMLHHGHFLQNPHAESLTPSLCYIWNGREMRAYLNQHSDAKIWTVSENESVEWARDQISSWNAIFYLIETVKCHICTINKATLEKGGRPTCSNCNRLGGEMLDAFIRLKDKKRAIRDLGIAKSWMEYLIEDTYGEEI